MIYSPLRSLILLRGFYILKGGKHMNIIIGISWPFANGELHIGHAASSLPGDIIARYHRLKGNKVILVSGTDCHGTPI